MDAEHLPYDFPVTGSLVVDDNARRVVGALHKVARGRPVLKLDVTVSDATLSVLGEGRKVLTYRWADGVIDAATSDFEYLGQATFEPDAFPIGSVGLMFDIADLLGVTGKFVYQVQDYRQAQVVQTVSSVPETKTIFFRKDATAVPELGLNTADDIAQGLMAVTDQAEEIVEFGFSEQRGYWALVTSGRAQVLRTRKAGIPVFEAPATGGLGQRPGFDPTRIKPVVLAQAIAKQRGKSAASCEVLVQVRAPMTSPSALITCDGQPHYLGLDGRSLDDELGPG